ncbi:hypothetical protein [Enterococcus sp. C50]|uniref:hypothetical protein n=1 Tax=Enterococcus sp. C50 TaxID=3231311 RepID=UPI0034A00F0C
MDLLQLISALGEKARTSDEKEELRTVYKEVYVNKNKLAENHFNWQRLRFYYCVYVDRTAFRKNKYLSLKLDEVINGLKAYLRSKS